MLIIGERIRSIRQEKGLSQGDIEKRSNLLRCYTSRIEHGHTVPSLDTLQKYASALEVPLYQLFYDGTEPKALTAVKDTNDRLSRKDRREVESLGRTFLKLNHRDRAMVRMMATKLAERK